ncbi:MAG: cytochrome c3 family protein [Nitrospiraceae bacterium]|nr:cytochrome c3 family protein [Nitrospiraceae bacterium]
MGSRSAKTLYPALILTGIIFLLAHAAWGAVDCLKCHPEKAQGKVVHPAVQMGCESCHSGVDASTTPHKFTGKFGLSALPPELCFQCHDKAKFTKKIQHPPVKNGQCLTCHTPHSGPYGSLLRAEGNDLCLKCHAEITQKPHVVMDFLPNGHLLAGPSDPVRKGKPFGCVSCHVPHSSDWGRLFRYKADNARDLCKYCHGFL